jgi:hypothetical protein
MADLPPKLFAMGKYGEKKEYFFVNLNGEEESVILDFGDRLANVRCPLDGAYMIAYSGDPHTVLECPACHKDLFGSKVNKEQVNNYIKNDLIPNTKDKIKSLKEQLNYLERILLLAGDSDNEIKKANLQNSLYNKANLSAQDSTENQ